MKIIGPATSLPQTGHAGVPARGRKTAAVGMPEPALSGAQPGQTGQARPVRISRYPEEAALFAYNRQAQTDTATKSTHIDEYV